MTDVMSNVETQNRKSWFARNWVWVIALAVLMPTLCCGGFLTVIVGGVMTAIKASEPYERSLELVQNDDELQAILGTPIKAGWMAMGEYNVSVGSGVTGNADITYSVTGQNGSGDVRVVAQRTGDVWTYSELTVDVNGQLIDLTPDANE